MGIALQIVLSDGTVYVSGLKKSDEQEVVVRNGDVVPVEVAFKAAYNSTQNIDLGTTSGLRLVIKPRGKFDANPVLSFAGWTRTGTGSGVTYASDLNLASGDIDKLLGVDSFSAPEIVTIQPTGASAIGKFFDLADASGIVRVFLNVASFQEIAPDGGRAIKVTVLGDETAAQIAAKIATQLNLDASFAATASADILTISATSDGKRISPHPRNSGYGVIVTSPGSDESVQDVSSVVLQAEFSWLYNSKLTTSRIFRWKTENTNRRAAQAPTMPFFDAPATIANAVLFSPQVLTTEQKLQVRTNIGAPEPIAGTPQNGSLVGFLTGIVKFATAAELGLAVDGGQV